MNTLKLVLLATVATGLINAGTAAASEKPNLVWIMADDLGYGELGCYAKLGQKACLTGHAPSDFIEIQRRTACLMCSCADTRLPSSISPSDPTVR